MKRFWLQIAPQRGQRRQTTTDFRISLCIRKVLRGAFSEDMSIESIFSRFNFLSV